MIFSSYYFRPPPYVCSLQVPSPLTSSCLKRLHFSKRCLNHCWNTKGSDLVTLIQIVPSYTDVMSCGTAKQVSVDYKYLGLDSIYRPHTIFDESCKEHGGGRISKDTDIKGTDTGLHFWLNFYSVARVYLYTEEHNGVGYFGSHTGTHINVTWKTDMGKFPLQASNANY